MVVSYAIQKVILQESRLLALDTDAIVVERIDGGTAGALDILAVVAPCEGVIGAAAVLQAHWAHTIVGTKSVESGATDDEAASGSHVGI